MTVNVRSLIAFVLLFVIVFPVWAQDKTADIEAKLKQNPNDAEVLNTYFGMKFGEIFRLSRTDAAKAKQLVDQLRIKVDSLSPDNDEAKAMVKKAQSALGFYERRLELAMVSLDDLTKKLTENPGDTQAISQYGQKVAEEFGPLFQNQPQQARQKLDQARQFLTALREKSEGRQNVVQAIAAVERRLQTLEEQLELAQLTLDDLTKKLTENPGDTKAISQYGTKVRAEANRLASNQPAEAEELLAKAKELLASIRERSEDNKAVGTAIDRAESSLASLERRLAAARKRMELIGQDAMAMQAEAWVNGDPLTDTDLKGKVVLLDFWAVWCGPCIATFPHLREWYEKYTDRGLVMIGVTSYYNYVWDNEAGRAKRSREKVSPEDERAMLKRFAEEYKLQYRLALQKDRSLAEFYGVTGIPQVVLIDRSGKIRLIKVGSGEDNAREISEMLVKLLEE
jgi:thiol-disulfide isomerase/thioredoxin